MRRQRKRRRRFAFDLELRVSFAGNPKRCRAFACRRTTKFFVSATALTIFGNFR